MSAIFMKQKGRVTKIHQALNGGLYIYINLFFVVCAYPEQAQVALIILIIEPF